MASTMKSITQALGSVDGKKENLRKAFEDLQSHSSSLSSFTLQWKDLEDHFDSIKKSIEDRFKELESKTNQSSGAAAEKKSSTSTPATTTTAATPTPTPAKEQKRDSNSHPELKSLCEKMDGIGLRSYILTHRKDLASIRNEVGIALQSASDPAKLVLDAMKGFYPPNSKGDKDGELAALRRTCLLLLEQLLGISPQIKPDIKDRAKKLAIEWKGKVTSGGDNPLEPLTLLQLLATYGLVSSLSGDELLDMAVSIARRKQAVDLIRSLDITDKIPDFIQKLTSSGKQLDAVKFVYAFELVDKFPPVPLLKEYFKQSKKVAQEIRNKGNHSVQSLNEATAKEIAALRSIVKCIEEHKLESEYPRGPLDKRVEQLEKQKADKKRPAAGSTPGDKKNQQQSGNKRPRPMASRNVSSNAPVSQNHLQPGSSLMDRYPSYMSSSAQYGLAGPTPAVPSYMSSAAGPYGLVGNPVSSYSLGGNPGSSYGMNLSPPRPNLYPSDSHLPGGLYDRSMGYGGHGMPPSHRSSFYP